MSNISVGNSLLDQYQVDQGRFAKGDELGKNEFLELLVAQLNNQDPMSPQENGEFIAQLAQFSTVEGIEKMNSTIDAMANSFQSSQALQASSLVGRTVVIPTDQAMVDPQAGFGGQLALPQASGAVLVNVYDEAGSVVSTINLGAQEAGIREFAWDGTDSSGKVLPAGKYRFEAQANINGETVQLATLLPANVDSVSLGVGHGGEMVLNLAGLGSIGLSEVFSIGK
ncbi:flagellar basal body rod modification protein [Pseudomonas saudimassiliensis]|uniref:Basal-body rod modification protein FlgD n=1 Tax=Pseudomonas saudimassiliensis TaxID=1461581 RepID=A0A078MN59_9PSED|nr:flagellar hook assembly protein FlgD [Pseudomonas saudimassiliensis]CEA06241.1 flagellar basal body rod modification protein [Pseudomonas saudimassiliensis]CEF27666.1 flagellar basal body rod modification protein [Pseudomonas saudimassiliensis]